MKQRFIAVAAIVALVLTSCSQSAKIDGLLEGCPDTELSVRRLDMNKYEVLDTIKTDASGRYNYSVKIAKGQPEFIYMFYKDVKVASLLLSRGEKVTVSSDTLGHLKVDGSLETAKLVEVEKSFADFSAKFTALADRLDEDGSDVRQINRQLSQEYVAYYRDRLKYVLENQYSLTVIPVFFQMVAPNLPLFAQTTDAIHFSSVCDSLATVYPESRYVKALRQEANRRINLMELNIRLENAPELSYPELAMPDVTGKKIRLGETKAKVVLLHFWSASDPAQKMFNLDVLKPVYADYHSKGLEIYQVAIDVDKATWARAVKDQNLEWINVCDGLGTSSPALASYNITKLPASFILSGGELVQGKITDEESLRRLLNKLLK